MFSWTRFWSSSQSPLWWAGYMGNPPCDGSIGNIACGDTLSPQCYMGTSHTQMSDVYTPRCLNKLFHIIRLWLLPFWYGFEFWCINLLGSSCAWAGYMGNTLCEGSICQAGMHCPPGVRWICSSHAQMGNTYIATTLPSYFAL